MNHIKYILPLTFSILFSACGGGGGGGGSTGIPEFNPPPPTIEETPKNEIIVIAEDFYKTEEYFSSTVLNRVGAATSYVNGYTGKGVIVAVLDTGINYNHIDLKNKIINGRDFTAYHLDTTDNNLYYTSGGVSKDQIASISISNGGSGYTEAPVVSVIGDGTGAKATAVIDNNGVVTGIYLTDHGFDYTNAEVIIEDSNSGSGLIIDYTVLGVSDYDGHGTGVSSLISAEKNDINTSVDYSGTIQGIAYDAEILPIKVLSDSGGTAYTITSGVLYAADNGAQIQNLSLGTTSASAFSSSDIDIFRYALSKNSSIVIAAGNEGLNCLPVNGSLDGQCSFPAATPWLSGNSDLLDGDGAWIVVGSVDSDNEISWFSNKAGVTKDNYLVAPGENIIMASDTGGYSVGSGTSFAAPTVSGAMALMIEKYPHLKGKDLAQIFFDTATDLGDPGVDDVYGHGLLNVEKAFAPIGTLKLTTGTTVSSKATTLKQTKLAITPAFGQSLIKSKTLESAVAFDNYDRDFNVNLTKNVVIENKDLFNIDSFSLMNYGNLILGFDQLNQRALIGFNYGTNDIVFSYSNDTFGSNGGSGVLSFNKGRTYYMSLVNDISTDNLRLRYQINGAYSKPKTNSSSMISNISELYGYGGEVSLTYNGYGVRAKSPTTIQKGSMTLHVPVSRNLNGTVNYSTTTENMSVSNREYRFGPYYQSKLLDYVDMFVSYDFIKNFANNPGLTAREISFNAKLRF